MTGVQTCALPISSISNATETDVALFEAPARAKGACSVVAGSRCGFDTMSSFRLLAAFSHLFIGQLGRRLREISLPLTNCRANALQICRSKPATRPFYPGLFSVEQMK